MRITFFTAIAIPLSLTLISGCAFKESATPNPESKPGEVAQASQAPVSVRSNMEAGPAMTFAIQWKKNELNQDPHALTRIINQDLDQPRSYFLQTPITVSETVPQNAEIEIKLPALQEKIEGNLLLNVKAQSSDLALSGSYIKVHPEVVPYVASDGVIALKFTINGLRTLLSDSEEQKAYLLLDIRLAQTGVKVGTVHFTLTTPPKQISFKQGSLEQYERANPPISDSLKHLESATLKLDLIQTLEVQNLGREDVSVAMPTSVQGKLAQKSTHFFPQRNLEDSILCRDVVDQTESIKVFAEEFHLLPLRDSTGDGWVKNISDSETVIQIPAHGVQVVGLYAKSNGGTSNLVKELKDASPQARYKILPNSTQLINTKCNFGCSYPRMTPAFDKQCESISSDKPDMLTKCESRVTACRSCISRWTDKRMNGNSSDYAEWGDDCNECHALEILEGFNQIRSYNGITACGGDWVTQVVSSREAFWGTKVENIILDLDVNELKAVARFSHSNEIDDPEGRHLNFLQSVSIQSQ